METTPNKRTRDVIDLADDDVISMETFTAAELSAKRLKEAVEHGNIIDLSQDDPPTDEVLQRKSKNELKTMCRNKRLKVSGNKIDLIRRLIDADRCYDYHPPNDVMADAWLAALFDPLP